MLKKSEEQLLEEFSELLIRLGREIEARLEEKEKLSEYRNKKEDEFRKLEREIFAIRKRQAKLSIELSGLELQRRNFEEKKLLLEKKKS